MRRLTRSLQRGARGILARLDAWFNALYTWRYNPLYHSGALVALSFVVLLVTGLYLLIFYRIGTPYASVARIMDQPLGGRWIRSLHRYASDLAVVAVAVHALRMFGQNRAWGPRALAWVSGLVLVFVLFVCGWTGYVMVWDEQAHVLAVQGARLFDVLPIFSEPIGRAFVGERPLPGAFFFLNLFAHIAFPVGLALLLWIHVSRLARANLLPPRPLLWVTVALFTVVAVAWPATLGPEADLLRLPGRVDFDVFYGFWLPAARAVGPAWVWLAFLAASAAGLAVPFLTRPARGREPPRSLVDERRCTGCEQCYHDCPYEAIRMVPREDGREGWVARVDPTACVSCGICAGSCAPMGVGPAGRTGRDQLAEVKAFIARERPGPSDVVIIACSRGAGGAADEPFFVDAPVLPVSCAGSLHTSVIEYLVRAGAGGVLVAACPPRDCWNREGVGWLEARIYHDREAELKSRVDRRRVRVVFAGAGEPLHVAAELVAFRRDVAALSGVGEGVSGDGDIDIDTICEVPVVSVAEEGGP
jgi:ferredoxin